MCQSWQWPNGNTGDCRLFGRRFEPRYGQYYSGAGAGASVCRPGFEPTTNDSAAECVTIRPAEVCDSFVSPLLGAFSAKTFNPPHPTPPHPLKKVLSSFRG